MRKGGARGDDNVEITETLNNIRLILAYLLNTLNSEDSDMTDQDDRYYDLFLSINEGAVSLLQSTRTDTYTKETIDPFIRLTVQCMLEINNELEEPYDKKNLILGVLEYLSPYIQKIQSFIRNPRTSRNRTPHRRNQSRNSRNRQNSQNSQNQA